jgi:hypothetical protein
MESWHSYPKVYALGHPAIKSLLNGPVHIEEKVDGSQFSFGVFDNRVMCRSRGQVLNVDAPEKMFVEAVRVVMDLQHELRNGWTYRAEYLQKPKHNTLCYDRIPANHLILFDINTGQEQYLSYEDKAEEAERLGLDVVPKLADSMGSMDDLKDLLERKSVLGGAMIEGVVVKNYTQFSPDGKACIGKYVSEKFKEIHQGDWKDRNPNRADIIERLANTYRTPARWSKAVQHMRESGRLLDDPKDIGVLIKEVGLDVLAECKDDIASALFQWAWPQLNRKIVAGLPEWYKQELASDQFKEYVP